MIKYNDIYNFILKKLLVQLPILYGRQLKVKNPKILKQICIDVCHPEITSTILLNYIDECTRDFIKDYMFNFKLYWVLMELQDYPKCDFGHRIEPAKNFRINVNPNTFEVSSTLAKRCNDHQCAQLNQKTRENAIKHFQETFGVDNPYQSPIIKEKIRKRNLELFGYEYASQAPQIKEYERQRCRELYGVDNYFQLPELREILNQPEIQSKRLNSLSSYNIEHYGVPWFVQTDKFKEMTKTTNGTSKEEKEIVDWLRSEITEKIVVGSYTIIQPKQLDIYVPSKKIAIEFNGIYYHSIEYLNDMNYHLNKTKMCEEKGIKLIHIWEDEWNNNKDELKKFILNVLNNTIDFEKYLKNENEKYFSVDRSKFNKYMIPDSYEVINETKPEIILRGKTDKDKYKVADCGKLIIKIKENH